MFVVHHRPDYNIGDYYYVICQCGCEFVVSDSEFAVHHGYHSTCLVSGEPSVMCPDCNELISKDGDVTLISYQDAQQYYAQAVTTLSKS